MHKLGLAQVIIHVKGVIVIVGEWWGPCGGRESQRIGQGCFGKRGFGAQLKLSKIILGGRLQMWRELPTPQVIVFVVLRLWSCIVLGLLGPKAGQGKFKGLVSKKFGTCQVSKQFKPTMTNPLLTRMICTNHTMHQISYLIRQCQTKTYHDKPIVNQDEFKCDEEHNSKS